MLKEEIFIQKPIDEVWDFIVLEYAKSFKCSPSQLKGKTTESVARTFTNKEFKITQTVTEVIDKERIEVVSENNRDRVLTGYSLIEDEDGTFLTTYEKGEGKESRLRTWNYKLWSMPLLRRSTVKRLRQRVESIKYILEEEKVEE